MTEKVNKIADNKKSLNLLAHRSFTSIVILTYFFLPGRGKRKFSEFFEKTKEKGNEERAKEE